MPKSENDTLYSPSLSSFAIGAACGLLFYLVVGLGLWTLWGPKGILNSASVTAAGGYWHGRVMSSPINLFSFMAFGMAITLLFRRSRQIRREEKSLDSDLLGPDDESLILPDDALEIRKRLKQMDETTRRCVVFRLLGAGLQRARANWSAEDCGEAIKTQAQLIQGQIEAGYSMIRYFAWAIPSIGFIGTVLGIGWAMSAMQGTKGVDKMSAAAGELSMAFDTTFVALALSLILMFILHRVQAADDGFLVRSTDWCMRRFVFRMHISRAKA